jgi:hypothetical protein
MVIIFLILSIPFAHCDYLSDLWTTPIEQPDYDEREFEHQSDAEVYHWDLGTPDNIPETVIIYDVPRCSCW